MSWSYDPALAADLDRVRFRLGDTDTTDQLLSNEEILAVLSESPDVYVATAMCAENLAAKYARQVDYSNMSLSVSASQRAEAFRKLAADLRWKAALRAKPRNPSQAVSFKRDRDTDTSAVQPRFVRDMDDELGQDLHDEQE